MCLPVYIYKTGEHIDLSLRKHDFYLFSLVFTEMVASCRRRGFLYLECQMNAARAALPNRKINTIASIPPLKVCVSIHVIIFDATKYMNNRVAATRLFL